MISTTIITGLIRSPPPAGAGARSLGSGAPRLLPYSRRTDMIRWTDIISTTRIDGLPRVNGRQTPPAGAGARVLGSGAPR